MKQNRIKTMWSAGKPVLNGWLAIPNSFSAEIMGEQGYDAITIDLQHGAVDEQTALAMFQAMRASDVVPMVRVPWLQPGSVMKMLDSGAYGVICPMINDRRQAEEFVSYLRYPPNGVRSYGPYRASMSAGADYRSEADREIIGFAMIETAEAMRNLREIVATPGLDAVYVGPADLAIGLTGAKYPPGFDREEPEIVDAIRQVLSAAHDAGIRAGLHCGTAAYAVRAIEWGFDLVTVASDARLLAAASSASVRAVRQGTASLATQPSPQPASGY